MKRKILDPIRDIHIRELIGGSVRVLEHTDRTFIGLEGTVIDESMGTFLIRSDKKDRRMPKKGAVIEFRVSEEGKDTCVRLVCERLVQRPVDRTKKLEKLKR